jgi:uncharacterized radical SAM superfamily Fe-S cluster-containing enzyme
VVISKLETLSDLKGKANVVVFGTGNFGKIVVQATRDCGITIEKVCDSNTSNWGTMFCGYQVVSPDELNENDIVLLATNISNRNFQRKFCESKEVKSIYNVENILRGSSWPSFYGELDLEWSLDRAQEVIDLYFFDIDSENETNLLKVKSLDVVLTERCSLKCVDCSNLMQYYEKPIGAEVEVLIQTLRNFLEVVDHVSELRLIGGEPLVSKNVERVLDTIFEYSNFDKIVLYTNGTVVPKESLLKKFQDQRVWIKISDYGPVSRKAELVASTCKSWGINCIHEQVTEWEDVGRILFRGRTVDENKVVFGNCCVNDTLTILHGQLYACPFSAHTDNLGVLKNAEADKVNMLILENLKEKIRGIYKNKDVLVACNLCNGRDHLVGKVVAGVQTKNPLRLQVSSA